MNRSPYTERTKTSRGGFPFIAAGLGFALLPVLWIGNEPGDDGATVLPLFTLLALCEFGFIVNAIGTWIAAARIRSDGWTVGGVSSLAACVLSCVLFASLGIHFWPL